MVVGETDDLNRREMGVGGRWKTEGPTVTDFRVRLVTICQKQKQ